MLGTMIGWGGGALGMYIANQIVKHFMPSHHHTVQPLGNLGVVVPFAQAKNQFDVGHMNYYAEHAAAAYGRQEAIDSLISQGWTRDNDLSNGNYQTMTKDGKSVLAYRGTDVTNPDDLLVDGYIAMGNETMTKRVKEAKDVARRAAEKYGHDNVTLTGHSLGANQGIHASRSTGLKMVGYNPGTGNVGLLNSIRHRIFNRLIIRP
jgi:hypothetical protein